VLSDPHPNLLRLLLSPALLTIGALLGLALGIGLLTVLPPDQYLFVPAGAFLGLLMLAFVVNRNH
jgi:hypothetical protein